MSYLLDNIKYQRSPALFRLEKFENNLRKQVASINMRHLPDSREQVLTVLKASEQDLSKLGSEIKGVNWYAFLFGFAVYHTVYMYSTKRLLNEMGPRALPHLGVCAAVGLATGALVGYNTASNFKLYRKFNSIQRQITKSITQETK